MVLDPEVQSPGSNLQGYNRGAVQLTSRDLVHVCPCNLVGCRRPCFFLCFFCLLQFQPSSTQFHVSLANRESLTSCRGRPLTPMGNGPRWVCPLCWPSCTPGGDDGQKKGLETQKNGLMMREDLRCFIVFFALVEFKVDECR